MLDCINTMVQWVIGNKSYTLKKQILVIGVLNVTPDSFSDGGCFIDQQVALQHALTLIADGADIIDVGGESSRPGAPSINADMELKRVIPIIEKLSKQTSTPISIDTRKALVAEACLNAGASIVNDVSGGQDPHMFDLVARKKCGYILMHTQGDPQTMQDHPFYKDVVVEVSAFLKEQLQLLKEKGVDQQKIVIDPGFGFGKSWEHNRDLLLGIPKLLELRRPIAVGLSRKSFIGKVTGTLPQNRLGGSLAAECMAMWLGASIIRTHEVAHIKQAAKMVMAIRNGSWI